MQTKSTSAPGPKSPDERFNKTQADRPVALKLGCVESKLRQQIKQAGGYWNPQQKAWILSHRKVLQLGLEQRIVDELEAL